jgi:hypothetical protein
MKIPCQKKKKSVKTIKAPILTYLCMSSNENQNEEESDLE